VCLALKIELKLKSVQYWHTTMKGGVQYQLEVCLSRSMTLHSLVCVCLSLTSLSCEQVPASFQVPADWKVTAAPQACDCEPLQFDD
jgi:hypothetical protein